MGAKPHTAQQLLMFSAGRRVSFDRGGSEVMKPQSPDAVWCNSVIRSDTRSRRLAGSWGLPTEPSDVRHVVSLHAGKRGTHFHHRCIYVNMHLSVQARMQYIPMLTFANTQTHTLPDMTMLCQPSRVPVCIVCLSVRLAVCMSACMYTGFFG